MALFNFSEALKSGSIGDVKQVVVTFGRKIDVPRYGTNTGTVISFFVIYLEENFSTIVVTKTYPPIGRYGAPFEGRSYLVTVRYRYLPICLNLPIGLMKYMETCKYIVYGSIKVFK